ncbi:MFS transporter [Paenibacillus athensensis]|uniref:Major facilitator superfamily (MFS) profile domain-containing protein n=1 Tax=Paenibacillus athensensis TaxID=1967502 RepID=A0A4Y8Q6P1_9BACL|nr:MFS transporter [Paenibacillus athensensis]MCD1259712.1 MFS transporter [Paenibacillus athensensis]
MDPLKRIVAIGAASYWINGATYVAWGAVLTELLAHYGKSYSSGGLLVFNLFLGFLSGVLSMPLLARRIGSRASISGCYALLAAAALTTALLPPWPVAVTLPFAAGFAFGLTEASVSTFVLLAADRKQADAFSKLEVAYGAGAMMTPLLSSLLIAGGLWRGSFLALGAGTLVIAWLWSRLSFGPHDARLAYRPAEARTMAAAPAWTRRSALFFALLLLVFFLYVGLENVLVNFLPSLFRDRLHASTSLSTLTVSFYWLTMVVGRLFAGRLAEKVSYWRYLFIAYAGSLAIVLLWMPMASIGLSFALVLLLGLLMSGMFAIGIIYANAMLPGRTEQTTSLLIAAGGLGGSLLPLATGPAMDRWGVGSSLTVVAGGLLLALLLLLLSRGTLSPHE